MLSRILGLAVLLAACSSLFQACLPTDACGCTPLQPSSVIKGQVVSETASVEGVLLELSFPSSSATSMQARSASDGSFQFRRDIVNERVRLHVSPPEGYRIAPEQANPVEFVWNPGDSLNLVVYLQQQ